MNKKVFMMNMLRQTWKNMGKLSVITALLVVSLFVSKDSQAAITLTRTSGTTFYTDTSISSPGMPKCGYVSFTINSSTAISDAWATISGFTGGNLSLGGGDDGIFHFGSFSGGQTRPVYFYLCSSYTTTNVSPAQSYDIMVYSGNPSAGGTQVSSTTVSTMIDNSVIQANPNQVNVIISGPNPATLGGIITMTVDGDTGTTGCSNPPSACAGSSAGPLYFTPATFTSWRADAYEMIGSNITLSGGNSGTYDNSLYIDTVPDSSTSHYVATYFFRAAGTTGTSTSLSPVSYLASGTQIKHTSLTNGAYSGGMPPITSAQSSVVLAKTVSHANLPAQGGRVTYTLTITNSGLDDVMLDSFIDVLPSGVSYVSGSSTFNGATLADPGISGSTLTWSSIFTIPAGSIRTLIFQSDLPATPGTYTNSASARIGSTIIDSTLQVTDNVPATATTIVLRAPTIAKSFSPTSLAVNGSATMTLKITNPNATNTLNGIAVSDTLPSSPAGMGFAIPSGASTTCPGATLSVSGTTIGITGSTLTAGQSCTITANVTSSSVNSYTNTTGIVSSTNGGAGGTASATLTFTSKPTITKSFSVPTIPQNGTATMTVSITNNSALALTGLAFDDLFPAGLVTANPPSVSPAAPCGGALSSWNGVTAGVLSATGGNSGVRLTGGGIATPGGSCTFAVNVTSATAGVYANTTGGANSNETSPAGPGSNTATLSVLSSPSVAKSFTPSTIGKGQTSTLTITLANTNATGITGAAFTDTYPASMTTAAIPNASTTCSGGSVSSTAGSITLSGAIIPANGSCTVTIDVTSNVVNNPGYVNTIGAGVVTTTNAGSNSSAASATLIVNATPTIAKSFSFNVSTGIATMNITITNNHTAGISGLSFTDLFPIDMFTANPPTLTPATPCGVGSSLQSWNGSTAGSLSATGGDTGIKLTAGQIAAAGGSCTFSINLLVNSLGVYANQTSGVTMTAPFAGTGSPSNIAAWVAPAVSKTFTPNTVGPGDISRMEIRITNPSLTTSLTGLALTDIYPTTATKPDGSTLSAAMINSATPNAPNACGGTVTAAASGTGVTLTGGSLAAGGVCTIAVDVRALNTTPATYYNTTNRVVATQGVGSTGSDALYIVNKPTVTKSFLTSPVTLSGGTATSVMRIVIKNNAGVNITSVSLSDFFPSLPSQMRWVNTVVNTCGGSLTDAAGAALVSNSSTGIKLTGGSITAAAVTCTIDVTVSVSGTGSYANTTSGTTSSANASPGPISNTSTLTAYLTAPSVSKAFANSTLQAGGTNRFTITLTNPNTAAISGVAFTDTYPANMFNAGVPNLVSSCGGTATAAPGSGTLSLSGGTISASGSCSLSVDVTPTVAGSYTNTLNANSITSTNANTAPAVAVSASTTALSSPSISKSFNSAKILNGGTSIITFTLTNPNTTALTGGAFTDTLTNMSVSGNQTRGGTCTGVTPAALTNGDTNLSFTGINLPGAGSCTITVVVTSTTNGQLSNTTSGVTTTQTPVAGAASNTAILTVGRIEVVKSFSPSIVAADGTTDLVFDLQDTTGANQTAITLTDVFPAPMVVDTPLVKSNTCGGFLWDNTNTVALAAGHPGMRLTGGTLSANGTCKITIKVKVGAATGTFNNLATNINYLSSTLVAYTSNTATVTVLAPPTISKVFGAGTIGVAGSTALNLTVTNPNTTTAISGIAFTDNLPAGLTAVNGSTATCGGTLVISGTNLLTFTGGTLAASANCIISTTVTGSTAGVKNNTTGIVSASGPVALTGLVSNTTSVTVSSAPTIVKSFAAANVALGGSVNTSFLISNSNTTALSGIAFVDNLPAGLSASNGTTVICGGNLVITGTNTLTFSGGTLAASPATCTITVPVIGTFAGVQNNTTGVISSTESGSGAASNTATVNIYAPPTVTKSFAPASVSIGGTSTMTITVTNPAANPGNLTGVSITDNYIGTLVNNAAGSVACSGAGSATLTGGINGGTSVGFNTGTIVPGGTCTITQSVSATATVSNTTGVPAATGPVAVTGTAVGPVTLTVNALPAIAKAFSPATVDIYSVSTMTFTITNSNGGTLTSANFTDTLTGFNVAAPATIGGTCIGVSNSPALAAGATALNLTVPNLAAGSCTITIPVSATSVGIFTNTSSGITTVETGAAVGSPSNTASLTVVKQALQVTKAPSVITATPGSTVSYVISYSNPNASTWFQNIIITDPIPVYTTFQSAICGPLPLGITSCTISAPAVGGTGTVTWTLGGKLDAGLGGTVTLSVRVD